MKQSTKHSAHPGHMAAHETRSEYERLSQLVANAPVKRNTDSAEEARLERQVRRAIGATGKTKSAK